MVLPRWADVSYRSWALAQAATLLAFASVAVFFDLTRPWGCSEYCDLTMLIRLFFAFITVGFAWVLVVVAFQRTLGWIPLAAGLVCNLLAVGTVWLALSGAAGGPPSTPAVYQLWYGLPLAVWPGIAAAMTVAAGLLSRRFSATRLTAIAWTVIAVAISAYLLTYLLPATDVRVAGLHREGVVILPGEAGWITDSGGHTLIRDSWPMIRTGDGYEITLSAGRWTVKEMCISATRYYGDRSVDIDVRPGEVTTVPMVCVYDRG